MKEVEKKNYDVVLAGCSQTYSRFSIGDFSIPLTMSSLRLIVITKESFQNIISKRRRYSGLDNFWKVICI